MFLSTLGYSNDKLLVVSRSSSSVDDQRGKTPIEKRGNNRNKLTLEQIDEIKAHIVS